MKFSVVRNSRGMTLVEIMIVLAIIGGLMSILLPSVLGKLEQANVKKTKIAMGQITNALNMYYTDCSSFPKALDGLSKSDGTCSNWGGGAGEAYMKKVPKDSWNHDFEYSVDGGNFTLKSFGKDGREGGDGVNKDITNEDLE